MIKAIVFIFFISLFVSLSAQENNTNGQLGIQYFNSKEYEKSLVFLKKQYEEFKTTSNLELYIKCLIELKEYETAEKILKKEIRKNPGITALYVNLGYLYNVQGRVDDGKDQYGKAIKKLVPEIGQIVSLANSFISHSDYEFAEKAYLHGIKLMDGAYNFNFELANIYLIQKSYQKMIDEYLDILQNQPTVISSVQNLLQQFIFADTDSNQSALLKQNIYKRVRSNPDIIVYSDLLIWIYIQERDFDNAIIQAKAVDKRNDENGIRLIQIGNIATENRNYNQAVNAYKYVIDKGAESELYIEAQNLYLNCLYKKVINDETHSKKELTDIEDIYISTLNKLGESGNTLMIIMNLSHLQAFYLNKANDAIERIKKVLEIKNISKNSVSELKLELADILLFTGEIWDATLYYAQVQYANENSPYGFEAKYKIAKIAYYTGDFLWAEAQLKVLKASTTKLIANDAFQISYLINQNINEDSSGTALKHLGNAEYLVYQNKDSLALLLLDSISHNFIASSIMPNVVYERAAIMKKNADFVKQAEYLEEIITKYNYCVLVDDALFELAELYHYKLNNDTRAKELYMQIFTKFPGSIYSEESRARFRTLRGDKNIEN